MPHAKSEKNTGIPRVLLVGTGRFGIPHLRALKRLGSEGRIIFAGAVVRDAKKARSIAREFSIETHPALTASLLKGVDAVDIVTPPETHFALAKQCLPYADVFLEKPLAMNAADAGDLIKLARKYKHSLFVGHIFRHHPLTHKLKKLVGDRDLPETIRGSFINHTDADIGREPAFEMLHLFDIIDFIWPDMNPMTVHSRYHRRVSIVDIRYKKGADAHFHLGWHDDEKKRDIRLNYADMTIEADYLDNTIRVTEKDSKKEYAIALEPEPLYAELDAFISSLNPHKIEYSSADMAARIVAIAERAIPKRTKRPKVAIIGGGIFGTSVAAELGTFCEVTVFERNSALLCEGSRINCFRHHHGYHYPRSPETVADIKKSRADFEEIFADAIDWETSTYYGLAKKGSLVGSAAFKRFCKKHQLSYKEQFPPDGLIDKSELSLSMLVPETSYDIDKLSRIATARLKAMPSVKVSLDTRVLDCKLARDGTKTISYTKKSGPQRTEDFDYVINATYANINAFTGWLGFERHPVRVDLAETLIIRLPIDPISITIIDGPFATLMPTGRPHEFVLYHVTESILRRYVPEDGLVKTHPNGISNKDAILKESLRFFPILKDAEFVESRIVNRGVQAYREHDDARVANLLEHGFGCWSILSGKILSSVSVGKRVAETIRQSTGGQRRPSRSQRATDKKAPAVHRQRGIFGV